MNQTFLQPFFSYGTSNGYTFTLNTEAAANWEAASGEQWTVPVMFLVSKVTGWGGVPSASPSARASSSRNPRVGRGGGCARQ